MPSLASAPELQKNTLSANDAGGFGPGLYNLFSYTGALSMLNGGLIGQPGQVIQFLSASKQINLFNTAIDFIRQREKFHTRIELEKVEEPAIDADAVNRMSAQELLKLVRKLSPATQGVFNLYVVEGYNHREIGTLLGISEGTSKWHLSEARKQLQHLLQTLQV